MIKGIQIYVLCFVMTMFIGCASSVAIRQVQEDNPITSFENIIIMDSIPKSIIQNKAYHWFIDNIRDSKTSIQLNDTSNGEIVGNVISTYVLNNTGSMTDHVCIFNMNILTKVTVEYQIKFLIKDYKFKYFILTRNLEQSNVSLYGGCDFQGSATNPQTIETIQQDILASNSKEIKKIAFEIHSYMTQSKTNEW